MRIKTTLLAACAAALIAPAASRAATLGMEGDTVVYGSGKLAAVAAKGLKLKVACSAACTATGTNGRQGDRSQARRQEDRLRPRQGRLGRHEDADDQVARKVVRKLKRLKTAKTTVKVVVKPGGKTETISRAVTLSASARRPARGRGWWSP